jgi:hypothetical protein
LPTFHLPRKLTIGEMQILEADLLHKPGVAIVLAEPGAGKTALLASVGIVADLTPEA